MHLSPLLVQTGPDTAKRTYCTTTFSVLHFLVVGALRYTKLTHVGFQAHSKIASRIVSYSCTPHSTMKLTDRESRLPWRVFLQLECTHSVTALCHQTWSLHTIHHKALTVQLPQHHHSPGEWSDHLYRNHLYCAMSFTRQMIFRPHCDT